MDVQSMDTYDTTGLYSVNVEAQYVLLCRLQSSTATLYLLSFVIEDAEGFVCERMMCVYVCGYVCT